MSENMKVSNYTLGNAKIAIVGLGYVGLPLAIEFAKKFKVLGFDINQERVCELSKGYDRTQEAVIDDLNYVRQQGKEWGLSFSANSEDLKDCNIYIVTVPTPIDQFKAPDLTLLLKASAMLGEVLKKGDIVIYESTVYPGCTEGDCVPVLEKSSGLKLNQGFFAGYSPERINPGDKVNTLTKIIKVTSGSTPEIALYIDALYASIIRAGTHLAPSIKVAEASKAIENAQRDVNISFVNELALIFDRMGIDTHDVLEAAGTKFNFLPFKPGLVGGHCISVDPYYLTHKSIMLGYHPDVILSGRQVNDAMGEFVAQKTVKLMIQKDIKIKGAKALILGVTFKENCPDVRNTRVIDIYHELVSYGIEVDIYDPLADPEEVEREYGVKSSKALYEGNPSIKHRSQMTDYLFDAIVLAVAHAEFQYLNLNKLKQDNSVIFDIKAYLDRGMVDGRL